MDLDQFALACHRYGVQLPRWDDFKRLRAAPDMLPAPAVRLLDLTPEEFTAETERRALAAMLQNPRIGDVRTVRSHLARDLGAEFLAVLSDHVDQIILGLRPAFDAAAEAARAVRRMGVSPTATVETLFDSPDDVRRAWREFTQRHAKTLDHILSLRQFMSHHLGAPPNTKRPNGIHLPDADVEWAVVITRPSAEGVGVGHFPLPEFHRPHARWLEVAELLYLPTVAELNSGDVAVAEGVDVRRLLAEARRRDKAGLSVLEFTDSATAGVRVDLSGFARLEPTHDAGETTDAHDAGETTDAHDAGETTDAHDDDTDDDPAAHD